MDCTKVFLNSYMVAVLFDQFLTHNSAMIINSTVSSALDAPLHTVSRFLETNNSETTTMFTINDTNTKAPEQTHFQSGSLMEMITGGFSEIFSSDNKETNKLKAEINSNPEIFNLSGDITSNGDAEEINTITSTNISLLEAMLFRFSNSLKTGTTNESMETTSDGTSEIFDTDPTGLSKIANTNIGHETLNANGTIEPTEKPVFHTLSLGEHMAYAVCVSTLVTCAVVLGFITRRKLRNS